MIGNWLKDDKTGLVRKIVLLGLQGAYPGADSDLLHSLALPGSKKDILA